MNATQKVSLGEGFGQRLRRVWRHVAHRETLAIQWLAAKGIPCRGGRLLFLIIKLVLSGLLLYAAFWLALLLFVGVAGAWVLTKSTLDNDSKIEWREGHSGFGLYDQNEWRRDMGDPEEPM